VGVDIGGGHKAVKADHYTTGCIACCARNRWSVWAFRQMCALGLMVSGFVTAADLPANQKGLKFFAVWTSLLVFFFNVITYKTLFSNGERRSPANRACLRAMRACVDV